MEGFYTSKVSISNGRIKYPIGKYVPLKFFPNTVVNADLGSQSLSISPLKMFVPKAYATAVKFR